MNGRRGQFKKLVRKVTASNTSDYKRKVVETLLVEKSDVRVVVATSLISMGIDVCSKYK